MRAGAAIVCVLLSACGLGDGSSKNACRQQSDCLAGYTCVAGLCSTPSDGTDGAVPTSDAGVDDLSIAPTCTDTLRNGTETGIDCGGSCPACALGEGCKVAADCVPTTTCSAIGATIGTCEPGHWASLAPMPTGRQMLAAVIGADGRLYALGGYGNSDLATVEAYDPADDTWTELAPMLHARSGFGAALGSDGRIYVAGGPTDGVQGPGLSETVESYDPVANTWRMEPSLGTEHDGGGLVAAGTRMWSVGGHDESFDATGIAESFAPGETVWTQSTYAMTQPRESFALAALVDGSLLAAGGYEGISGGMLASVELFDPAKPGWKTTAAMTNHRYLPAAATIGGKVYVTGGSCNQGGCAEDIVGDTEVFDPATKTWSLAARMKTPRFGHAVAATTTLLYAVGGNTTGTTNDEAVFLEVLTP